MSLPETMPPEKWMTYLFTSQTAAAGGVVRRNSRDVERIVGRDRFLAEHRLRGFQAIENNGQIVVFCNQAPVRPLA